MPPTRDVTGRFMKMMTDAAEQVAGGAGATGPAMGVGGASASAGAGILGKLLQGTKSAGAGMAAHPWMTLIALMLASRGLKKDVPSELMGLQTQMMEGRAEKTTPESMYYQAMAPQAQAQEQGMQSALINKLLGTAGPSNQLARGEAYT